MFKHSVKVPRLYKIAAKIVQEVKEEGTGVKQLVYQAKHPNIKALYALVVEALQHGSQLDFLIRSSNILQNETRLDAWLARVLITEMLWGKQRLAGDAKPIETVLSYQDQLVSFLPQIPEHKRPNKVTKPRYVRVNTLMMNSTEAINGFRDEGWMYVRDSRNSYKEYLNVIASLEAGCFTSDFHLKDLLVFPPGTQFYKHECYRNGSIILQDKSSCLPAFLLNPDFESKVLDMCAAPGMKTSHLAAIMQNKGSIYAVEKDQRRAETLSNLIEATNSSCVEVINRDVITLTEKELSNVEYILVDPSCSGSGMIDRLDVMDVEEKSNPERVERLAGFQKAILRHALRKFSKAKRIVYSTCSVYPQENEEVVQEVLQRQNNYKLIDAKSLLKQEWVNVGADSYGDVGEKCLYARPEVDYTNGFFIAVFERLSEEERKCMIEEEQMVGNSLESDYVDNERKFIGDNVENTSFNRLENNCDETQRSKRKKRKKSVSLGNDMVNEFVPTEHKGSLDSEIEEKSSTDILEINNSFSNKDKRKLKKTKNEIPATMDEDIGNPKKHEVKEHKSKQKKKKFATNEINTGQNVCVNGKTALNQLTIDNTISINLKEKKRKRKVTETMENNEIDVIGKKKKTEVKGTVIEEPGDEIIEKKKKKKPHVDPALLEDKVNGIEERKKKKAEINPSIERDIGVKVIEKKRRKGVKINEVIIEDNEISEIIAEDNNIHIKEKKTKKKTKTENKKEDGENTGVEITRPSLNQTDKKSSKTVSVCHKILDNNCNPGDEYPQIVKKNKNKNSSYQFSNTTLEKYLDRLLK